MPNRHTLLYDDQKTKRWHENSSTSAYYSLIHSKLNKIDEAGTRKCLRIRSSYEIYYYTFFNYKPLQQ